MALILFRISKISIIILSQKLLIIYMIFLEQEIGLKFFFLQLNNKSVMAAIGAILEIILEMMIHL